MCVVIHRLGYGLRTIVLLGNGVQGSLNVSFMYNDRRKDMSTSDHMFAHAFVIAIKDEGYSVSHTYPAKRWSFHAVGLIVRPRPAVTCNRREQFERRWIRQPCKTLIQPHRNVEYYESTMTKQSMHQNQKSSSFYYGTPDPS